VLHNDTTLLLWTSDEGKKVACVADMLCLLASQKGMMQVTLIDHDMVQMMQDLASCSFTVCSCLQRAFAIFDCACFLPGKQRSHELQVYPDTEATGSHI